MEAKPILPQLGMASSDLDFGSMLSSDIFPESSMESKFQLIISSTLTSCDVFPQSPFISKKPLPPQSGMASSGLDFGSIYFQNHQRCHNFNQQYHQH